MSNDMILEEGTCRTRDPRYVMRQMPLIQDFMNPVLLREDERSSNHSDLIGLDEPPFIRRSTCFDIDCGVMRSGYIFL